jgi:hypothetical protein
MPIKAPKMIEIPVAFFITPPQRLKWFVDHGSAGKQIASMGIRGHNSIVAKVISSKNLPDFG